MTDLKHVNAHAIVESSSSKGWYTRGFLPHFDAGSIPQAITFRLADSLPVAKYRELSEALNKLGKRAANSALVEEIDRCLDIGLGDTYLARSDIAELVQSELLHWEGERYQLHAWVIMPNHVHVLITPNENESLPKLVHSWKSFTANRANKMLGRSGPFWQREYFDRFVRDRGQFDATVAYIENNPVKAGLCAQAENWPFSSATRNAIWREKVQ